MAPIIYKMDPSPPARAVMMVADIIGAPVILKEINVSKGEHLAPSYVKKNPLHTIPFLEDGDLLLNDSHAIAAYLVDAYARGGQLGLYPRPVRQRALVDARLHFDSGVLFPRAQRIIRKVMLHGATGGTANEIEELEEAYSFLDTLLSRASWLAGERLTIADVCVAATLSCSQVVLPYNQTRYPHVASWQDKISEFPWYQKLNDPGAETFAAIYKKRLSDNAIKLQNGGGNVAPK